PRASLCRPALRQLGAADPRPSAAAPHSAPPLSPRARPGPRSSSPGAAEPRAPPSPSPPPRRCFVAAQGAPPAGGSGSVATASPPPRALHPSCVCQQLVGRSSTSPPPSVLLP